VGRPVAGEPYRRGQRRARRRSVYEKYLPDGGAAEYQSRLFQQCQLYRGLAGEPARRGNVLVLFPSLSAIQQAVQQGFDVTSIQVGGLGGGPNRKAVFQNITLDEKDVGILGELKNSGIQVFFQTIPEDKPQSLDDILKKF
jgi:mannose/fructose/N-acetylgalactosamine-specific phosphotransferase system component IIB